MSEPASTRWIWPESGIEDLVEPEAYALSAMREVEAEWFSLQEELRQKGQLQGFLDRITREAAVTTGEIENLYSIERGVTATLIELGFSPERLPPGSTNADRESVLALITDQRDALEGLFSFIKQDRPLSTSYIKELHTAMTRSQQTMIAFGSDGRRIETPMIHGAYKQKPNSPYRDGIVYEYCPPIRVDEEMERLLTMHLAHEKLAPEVEAAWLHHRFTQIHPFQDGNGRVARALASLVFLKARLFPVSIPLAERDAYIEALEHADRGDLQPLVLTLARRQQIFFIQAQSHARSASG